MKKFNAWPWAIVLVFLVFASGMIYVAVLFINNKPDLIVEDYYAAEVKFQEEINKIENANALEDGIQIDVKKDFIFLGFPETFNPDKTKGKVFLTRNDDAKMDKEWDLELDGNRQQAIGLISR